MKTGLKNVLLPTLFNVVNNIVQHCHTWLQAKFRLINLFSIVDKLNNAGSKTLFQPVFIMPEQVVHFCTVPADDNLADLASRGGHIKQETLWKKGPEWLQSKEKWPNNPVTESSPGSKAEGKPTKEILNVAQTKEYANEFDRLLERVDLLRALRVGVWIRRLIHNCRNVERKSGPITTKDVITERSWRIRRVQEREQSQPHFAKLAEKLGLRTNTDNLLVCHGRIQGQYPVFLPRESKLVEKLVQRIRIETLHGGVNLTMAAVCEQFWMPRLRSLVNNVRSSCHGCKRFRATSITKPVPGQLPEERTTVEGAFEVIGTDFAGPIRYKRKSNRERKANLTIFACGLPVRCT